MTLRSIRWFPAVLASLAPVTAPARPAPAPTPTAAEMIERLGSPDPARRSAAFSTMRECGGLGGQTYAALLDQARPLHRRRLEQIVASGMERVRPFVEAEARWRESRDAAMKDVTTDWKKDPSMIAKLTEAFERTERFLKAVERQFAVPSAVNDELVPVTRALREIDLELAWCNPKAARPRPRLAHLDDVTGGNSLREALARWRERSAAAVEFERIAETHKRQTKWAGRPQIEFAALLNWRRHVPAEGHSREMKELGYFAHESPIEDHQSPARRAELAGFSGRWTGENIYAGSEDPRNALDAWWASDGHRFIMFQVEANTLGLGVVGSHWTLNTGRKPWSDE
jgi:hypothetical protein